MLCYRNKQNKFLDESFYRVPVENKIQRERRENNTRMMREVAAKLFTLTTQHATKGWDISKMTIF